MFTMQTETTNDRLDKLEDTLPAYSDVVSQRHCKVNVNGSGMEETGDLHAIDENYVCDISLMRIDDNNQANCNSLCIDDDDTMALTDVELPEPCQFYHDEVEVEVEIDRNQEEQTITELVRASSNAALVEYNENGRMRVVFGILVRLVLPLANGVARGFKGIRDVRVMRVLQNLATSRQALTNLVAFAANTISMNLSSVQVSNRLSPLLKLLKLRKSHDGIESLPDTLTVSGASTLRTSTTPTTSPAISPFLRQPRNSLHVFSASSRRKTLESVVNAPKCCTVNILAEPPPGTPILADIVFIHGLHGGLVNTWKQGLWENERHPVEFERPPKPPVRPPKRPRHSRSTTIHQQPKEKRAKFAHAKTTSLPEHIEDLFDPKDQDDIDIGYTYVCGEPQNIQICENIEYSFPTFRLRMNENSRLLQAQLEYMLQSTGNSAQPNNEQKINSKESNESQQRSNIAPNAKCKQGRKPSADDPNYTKCWPGDWLPLDCPGVRVIAVNYTTDQYLWRPLWKSKEPRSNLVQRAREMAELLVQHRVGNGHPIVYVGHSKGGLYIKQIIVDAWECGKPAMTPLWRSAKGVFFYSVPHRGSHLASIKAPLLTRSVELLDIEKNNKYLLDLHRRFAGLYHLGHLKIEVFSFVETALTLMSLLYLRIVGVDSADPGIGDVCGIRLDHREICKPRSRDCILYRELVKMIKKVC